MKLTLLQAFTADYFNLIEAIFIYRLLVGELSFKLALLDIIVSFFIVISPISISAIYSLIIVIYIILCEYLGNKNNIVLNSIIAMIAVVVMNTIFDLIDFLTNEFLLSKVAIPYRYIGWSIPLNSIIITIIISFSVIKFFQSTIDKFNSSKLEFHQLWGVTFVFFMIYMCLSFLLEIGQIANRDIALILLLYLTIMVTGIISFINFTKSSISNYYQNKLIENYQGQIKYSQRINKQFDNFRRERHDIKNLLLGVQGYIKDGENDKAEKMLSAFLDTNISDKHYLDVDNALSKLQISGLRNLIKEKAYQIVEQGIPLAIEINNEISSLPGSEVKTARIIGILLDNAIEATKSQKKPYVQIALLQHDKNLYELIVANSLGTPVNINKAMKFEHSTKHGHQGIGLSNVMKLVDHDQHYSFSAEVKDKVIIMTCFIQGKSE